MTIQSANADAIALLDDPIKWGYRLIATGDHDPLYIGLSRWETKQARLARFLLAYWCCYNVGASWWISQHSSASYWKWLRIAAQNEVGPREAGAGVNLDRWPRAHERRHWRGQKCVDCVDWMAKKFPYPESAVQSIWDLGRTHLAKVEAIVCQWPQFGPWIAFKAADMMERVMGQEIEFSDSILTMYKDPKLGAEMAAPLLGLSSAQAVADTMLQAYRDVEAPGSDKRPRMVNVQEVETVLCKWKSARNGHYHIGLDTRDHRADLEMWGAHDLLKAYPSVPA